MKRLLPIGLLLAALPLAACGSGLSVDSYPMAPRTSVDCDAMFADGVQSVAGQDRVSVKDDNALAWGDPAIILRCGVEKPDALEPSSRCDMVAGVGWLTEPIADGLLFTTIGRRFYVSVEVPNDYEPAADALVDLAKSVEKHDPLIKPCV